MKGSGFRDVQSEDIAILTRKLRDVIALHRASREGLLSAMLLDPKGDCITSAQSDGVVDPDPDRERVGQPVPHWPLSEGKVVVIGLVSHRDDDGGRERCRLRFGFRLRLRLRHYFELRLCRLSGC